VVLELAGITDILTKSQGTDNKINVVRATILGLSQIRDPQQVLARRKSKPIGEETIG
jgi:small subunit ribosomal protein S5